LTSRVVFIVTTGFHGRKLAAIHRTSNYVIGKTNVFDKSVAESAKGPPTLGSDDFRLQQAFSTPMKYTRQSKSLLEPGVMDNCLGIVLVAWLE
jgi:hypothetical protein